jgi:UDP-N-acetylmuramoylalanine--D-glutamate ligase
MIQLAFLAGKKVGVLGLGKAGRAAVEALIASDAQVYVWDDKASADGLNTQAHFCPVAQWPWQELTCMVMSPGIPYTYPAPHPAVLLARDAGVEVCGEVELLARACPHATLVGITGTNGKSTTTALIGHILASAGKNVQVGGNLGTPALALDMLGADGIYVIEMSSYQLDLVHTARFHVACLMNITPDHLDRHGGMDGYILAKKRIFAHQAGNDTAVIGIDDAYCQAIADELLTRVHVVELSVHHGEQMDVSHCTSLQGLHNLQNALVARAACRALGVSDEVILAACASYVGLPHRMEWLGEKRGVCFVNDSKATNADSTEKALMTYDEVYWIVGGLAKAGGIASLDAYFARIRHAYVYGQDADIFADTLAQHHVPFTRCATMEEGTRLAAKSAFDTGNGVVLLSPAAASFDQFTGFEQRGDVFKACVAAL